MSPDDPRHGSRAGYDAHRAAGQDACRPCSDAAARYQRGLEWDLLNGRSRRVPALGTLRRLRALVALGWTTREIGDELGMHRNNIYKKLVTEPPAYVLRSTAEHAAALFDRWSMTVPPASPYVTRAKNLAAREGWSPPLAWDNIDDPNEAPVYDTRRHVWTHDPELERWVRWWTTRGYDDIDHAVVERVLSGARKPRRLTESESVLIVARARALGMSHGTIEDLYGIKADRYTTQAAAA